MDAVHDAFGEEIDRDVVVRASEYPGGYRSDRHWHGRAQLVYACAGVVKVTADTGSWVVPQHRGVWIPAKTEHQIESSGPVSMRSVYVREDSVDGLPQECGVVAVSPLLRELILGAVDSPKLYEPASRTGRIMDLILDEVRRLPVEPLHLPEPWDPRARQITTALREHPENSTTLEDWGPVVGASPRTLARLFLAETGMTFRHWQRQARLLEGLMRLASGEPVTTVALEVGYENPSAFISMFRRSLGVTPGKYFSTDD
ncbi:MAG: AraC family transcriptional regulator [SAR202 cluster bacterium]|nr:AraC family transcriptional regulator [Chloroflexota bacterium]MQG34276.1 AraC family transcriptional regulator [SAR202 cluster bacterium]HCP24099.1 AraC family transcriptional regulator [Dehalococcoidia bacterium]